MVAWLIRMGYSPHIPVLFIIYNLHAKHCVHPVGETYKHTDHSKTKPKSRVTNSNAQGAQGTAEIGEADGRGIRAASPRAHSSPEEDGQCWTRVVSPSHSAS